MEAFSEEQNSASGSNMNNTDQHATSSEPGSNSQSSDGQTAATTSTRLPSKAEIGLMTLDELRTRTIRALHASGRDDEETRLKTLSQADLTKELNKLYAEAELLACWHAGEVKHWPLGKLRFELGIRTTDALPKNKATLVKRLQRLINDDRALQPRQTNALSLPAELILKVAWQLDFEEFREVMNIEAVCRFWRAVLFSEQSWWAAIASRAHEWDRICHASIGTLFRQPRPKTFARQPRLRAVRLLNRQCYTCSLDIFSLSPQELAKYDHSANTPCDECEEQLDERWQNLQKTLRIAALGDKHVQLAETSRRSELRRRVYQRHTYRVSQIQSCSPLCEVFEDTCNMSKIPFCPDMRPPWLISSMVPSLEAFYAEKNHEIAQNLLKEFEDKAKSVQECTRRMQTLAAAAHNAKNGADRYAPFEWGNSQARAYKPSDLVWQEIERHSALQLDEKAEPRSLVVRELVVPAGPTLFRRFAHDRYNTLYDICAATRSTRQMFGLVFKHTFFYEDVANRHLGNYIAMLRQKDTELGPVIASGKCAGDGCRADPDPDCSTHACERHCSNFATGVWSTSSSKLRCFNPSHKPTPGRAKQIQSWLDLEEASMESTLESLSTTKRA
ncbi:uncharacterized protein L969DRAFT_20242 [Mixia osmundae IAM 14324]|uniref:F-box domain-containing protein n=1 Tax=Mixia osmundae (strain CBS 9802 / IAM 14324 / JCM 22182 / KY 12970) TaxID=764103 RepID=G7DWB2_MIXOS|nr:uncharacterized protein L969DRAFT_20242 [Mixia osmundae IAM 14324]KEI36500.1 hypothetical protein L969DRAFT_20242 [Mixia osmundae IAM 14324]GAA94800.1 hypothetical protein E5Q_01454 [Mixia osmundae IAM 14324]